MEDCFIDSTRNDKFSYLRGLDLQELILQIENFDLEYRDKLDLPSYLSFGIEIEYEYISKISVDKFISKNFYDWISKGDDSLLFGGEINSPVLNDEISRWNELKLICTYLKRKKADTFHNAGGHIHIGAHVLGEDVDNWKKFFKVYMVYESILFRFLYGDKITGREKIIKYARPIADDLYFKLEEILRSERITELFLYLPTSEKYLSLNFANTKIRDIYNKKDKNTLEFRGPNATIEEVIWQNNVNALAKLVLSPRYGLLDEELLDYKLKYEMISSKDEFYLYNVVNLKNALEFVDMIFDNNLDKIYFLRQYIKDFKEEINAKSAIESKKFIK